MTKPPPLPLKPNDKVKIGINEYTGATRVEGGYELISVADKSLHLSLSDDTLLTVLQRGELEVAQNFYKRLGRDGSPLDNLAVSKLPVHERLEVCRRHAWVIFFLDGRKPIGGLGAMQASSKRLLPSKVTRIIARSCSALAQRSYPMTPSKRFRRETLRRFCTTLLARCCVGSKCTKTVASVPRACVHEHLIAATVS